MAKNKVRPHTGNLSILFGILAIPALIYVAEFEEHSLNEVYVFDGYDAPNRYDNQGEIEGYPFSERRETDSWGRHPRSQDFVFEAEDINPEDITALREAGCFEPSIYGRFNVFQSMFGGKDRDEHDLAAINPVPCPE